MTRIAEHCRGCISGRASLNPAIFQWGNGTTALFSVVGLKLQILANSLNVMMNPPKVFVSHASEDKQRFVLKFAERLRANGIDAWLDKWEMSPGDSLVQKIFEQGIKDAGAVIVVLSNNSVNKPWVREEIDAAFVKRINGASKLIPLVIDDCPIPECLKSTVWERVADVENFETALANIVRAVFGQTEKPPIGAAPLYIRNAVAVAGLTPIDSALFAALCGDCIDRNIERVDGPDLLKLFESLNIKEDEACDCLLILEGRGYVELLKIQGVDIGRAGPTHFGFHEYLRSTRSDYGQMLKKVALLIVNEQQMEGAKLCKSIGQPVLITNRIVQYFERRGWIQAVHSQLSLSDFIIHRVSPELKRWLQQQP